jgi:general secretion pathway protein M
MRLARREKYLVALAGSVIVLLVLFHFIILPFFESKDRLKEGAKSKEATLNEMIAMSAEYKTIKRNSQGLQDILAKRNKETTLFSFLEKEADNANIKSHIKYMKPSVSQGTGPYKESIVEIKLEAITLKQLVGYLYRIESPEDVIGVKRISIKENTKEPGYLDTILQVMTLEEGKDKT